jgi:hypothetical protein
MGFSAVLDSVLTTGLQDVIGEIFIPFLIKFFPEVALLRARL